MPRLMPSWAFCRALDPNPIPEVLFIRMATLGHRGRPGQIGAPVSSSSARRPSLCRMSAEGPTLLRRRGPHVAVLDAVDECLWIGLAIVGRHGEQVWRLRFDSNVLEGQGRAVGGAPLHRKAEVC